MGVVNSFVLTMFSSAFGRAHVTDENNNEIFFAGAGPLVPGGIAATHIAGGEDAARCLDDTIKSGLQSIPEGDNVGKMPPIPWQRSSITPFFAHACSATCRRLSAVARTTNPRMRKVLDSI